MKKLWDTDKVLVGEKIIALTTLISEEESHPTNQFSCHLKKPEKY